MQNFVSYERVYSKISPTYFSDSTMKCRLNLAAAFMLVFASITLPAAPTTTNTHNTVNAILGDVSFVKKFGNAPNAATNERLRLQTHLEYVEGLLRAADVSHLPKPLRERRATMLALLHEYRLTGEFPVNLDVPGERRPCFIDAAGNICAVGYLIERTAGRALAERITASHKYDFLATMQMPELDAWVTASGLTARECAMIQPSYGPPRLDPDFRVNIVSPTTTSANGTAYTMVVQMVGMPDLFYRRGDSIPIHTWVDLNISPRIRISRMLFNIYTTGTVVNRYYRWNGTFTLWIPAESNVTSGTYSLTLRTWEQLGDGFYTSTTFTVSPATSVQDLTLPSPIALSPNPVHEALTLALPEKELHTIRLRTALGTAVSALSDASGATTLDMDGLAAGVYFVEVESTTSRRRWMQKVVKY